MRRFGVFISAAAVLVIGFLALRIQGLANQVGALQAERSQLRGQVAQLEGDRAALAAKLDAAVEDLGKRLGTGPAPSTAMETGIVESREAFPNITTGMVVQNRWQGAAGDGGSLIVFAGAAGGQGTLLVVRQSRAAAGAWGTDTVERYPTPTDHGKVRITAEQDRRLTLEAEDGTMFTFDISSRSFLVG